MWSSRDSGQTEPLAALVAVFALGVGLTLYAGALDSVWPLLSGTHETAALAVDATASEAADFGVVAPPITEAAAAASPAGYRLNATLRADGRMWHAGQPRPADADCDRRTVSVRTAPGRVSRGLLEVCVWRGL
ncbi:uncharacterized protein NP_5210A [Natronomonas pharaonis DSM 2160]|uniref:Uncharacterized protein n=1 Tax=Natronomonas pharaonis (strain ATCC 35678 / DSM 2160 / CIP 103997 / JCM 8858 / NBRC 14720 / NCIMB 2260 / Gabara) TaxID=348780 RepID=A0A1U7EZI0_NATPD|nr:hypothetical protein [Natronomonas pharaonis]CAI50696.2 uncharacterized protein NP_5210A [Natronomonas pharaonis DSM 2160]